MEQLANPHLKKFLQLQQIIQGESPDIASALTGLHEYQESWNFVSKKDVLQAWLLPQHSNQQAHPQSEKPRSILSRADANENRFSALSAESDSAASKQESEWPDLTPMEQSDEGEEEVVEDEEEQGGYSTSQTTLLRF